MWKFPLPNFSKVNHDVWLKITDYGISRVSSTAYEIRTSNISGTPGYIAPEVLLGRNFLQADKVATCIQYTLSYLTLIYLKLEMTVLLEYLSTILCSIRVFQQSSVF